MEHCNITHNFDHGNFCIGQWDEILCWPPTEINTTVTLPCPVMRGSDPSKSVTRFCGENGDWKTKSEDKENSSQLIVNYSECFTEHILVLLQQLSNMSQKDFQTKMDIVKITRNIELAGLSISLLALVLSFAIYYYFRSLRNVRTRIHMHLMAAVFCSTVTKLILFFDQLTTGYGKVKIDNIGFNNTPILCESAYVLLEYSKSATNMWMFIEALHLHRAVAVTATKMSFKKLYLLLGWGLPSTFVTIWSFLMLLQPRSHCWLGYNYQWLFWVLEFPRISALLANTVYLAQIVKVVFVKLKQDNSTEIQIYRGTAKSMITLLPLFGITNYVSYAEPNFDGPIWYFSCYCFTTYFLSSFQGFFISLMYCLLNTEVRKTISKINLSFISWSGSQQMDSKSQKQSVGVMSLDTFEPNGCPQQA